MCHKKTIKFENYKNYLGATQFDSYLKNWN